MNGMFPAILLLCIFFIVTPSQSAIIIYNSSGTFTTKPTLVAAATDPDTVGKKIVVTAPTDVPSTLTVWPADRNLIVDHGGMLILPERNQTFAINGPFSAGLYQIFSGNGTITFGNGALVSVYPEWWGAKADGLNSSALHNTSAIHAAIATKCKVTFTKGEYIHNGIVLTSVNNNTFLEGSGWGLTKLTCNQKNVHNISITAVGTYAQYFTIKNMSIQGNGSNGCGIFGNGLVWYNFDGLYISNNGSHGIQLTDTGTPSIGSYIGTINACKMFNNKGDGLYQVGTSNKNQQNASFITNCEMQANANGATVWGMGICLQNNVIEGNKGHGIRVQNFLTRPPSYSAISISIDNNYLEANPLGHIYVKAGRYGYIGRLSINDNVGYQNLSIVGETYKSLFIEPGNENMVTSFRYDNNNWTYDNPSTGPIVEADFGNVLSYGSTIIIPNTMNSTSTLDSINATLSKYINFGNAKIEHIKSNCVSGYFHAKGGNGITYSTLEKSANITSTGSYTYYPIDVPLQSKLFIMSIPVETDSDNYSITYQVLGRSNSSIQKYTEIANITLPGSGTTTISTSPLNYYSKNSRITSEFTDVILKVVVTINKNGTFFYLGNPTVYYN